MNLLQVPTFLPNSVLLLASFKDKKISEEDLEHLHKIPQFSKMSSTKRKLEFYRGRKVTQEALRLLAPDLSLQPSKNLPFLPINDRNLPLWPEGTNGSISHSDTWAAAYVCSNPMIIGVDVQTWVSDLSIAPKVLHSEEWQNNKDRWNKPEIALTTLYSIKECIIKMMPHYPDALRHLKEEKIQIEPNSAPYSWQTTQFKGGFVHTHACCLAWGYK